MLLWATGTTSLWRWLAKKVYAFDIQEQAVEKTRQRLAEAGFGQCSANLGWSWDYEPIRRTISRLLFCNLGYPAGWRTSLSLPDWYDAGSTEKVCREELRKRRPRSYHDLLRAWRWRVEKDAVLNFVSQLLAGFHRCPHKTINQINNPPFLVMIEIERSAWLNALGKAFNQVLLFIDALFWKMRKKSSKPLRFTALKIVLFN